MILERLIIAEMRTSAPAISSRPVESRKDFKCPTSSSVSQPYISLIDLAQQGTVACQQAVPEAHNTAEPVEGQWQLIMTCLSK